MDNNTFLRFIANSRDCEHFRLDDAIKKGINRARNDRFDSKKILRLAAACVFTFVMCVTINLRQFKVAAEEYYLNRYRAMPGSAEVLDGYMNSIVTNFKRFIGEE